jgi:hypothetical protein
MLRAAAARLSMATSIMGPGRSNPAEVDLPVNTMTQSMGIRLPDTQPLSHLARYQEVVACSLAPIDRA